MPHLIYIACGFPPAAKSSAYRLRATANAFAAVGWDVTVITLENESWERENGLDWSLMADVDPSIEIVELPIAREDLDPNIRNYSWLRARFPDFWRRQQRKKDVREFPEVVFGSWRKQLEKATEREHLRNPADLILATPTPYVTLAAALYVHDRHHVPFIVDYRDGWSLDVIGGDEAFAKGSEAGKWEQRIIDACHEAWFVNNPIRTFYANRYPNAASRMRVVRNGFDRSALPDIPERSQSTPPLKFGYLGTMTITYAQTELIIEAWRQAREREPLLADATLEFRGFIGTGFGKHLNRQQALLASHQCDGISYGGPVNKSDVAGVYADWDALLLALLGGKYVTSGKVYEYMATGLPVVSAHEYDHAASEVLEGYPLWARASGLTVAGVADAFIAGAKLAVGASPDQRKAARAHAERFERTTLTHPVVAEITSSFLAASNR